MHLDQHLHRILFEGHAGRGGRARRVLATIFCAAIAFAALGCEEVDNTFCPGCATTDASSYLPGQDAFAAFTNNAESTRYLGGCTTFEFQKRVGRRFESRGNPIVCVFEGFVVPVEPGETLEEMFSAPLESGEWRLAYATGAGCQAQQPLNRQNCTRVFDIFTPSFFVEREICPTDTPECRFVPLAPNVLCDDGVTIGGPSALCTRDPASGVCGYEIIACPVTP